MSAVLLNRITLVLAFVGVFITGVLSINHVRGLIPPCGAEASCASVLTSPYAKIGPLPVAYVGLVAYAFLAALAIVRAMKGVENARGLITIGYIVAAIGTLASLGFTYISVAVLKAMCPWCLTSAITMTLTLIAYALLAQTDPGTDVSHQPSLVLDGAMSAVLFGGALIAAVMVGGHEADVPMPVFDAAKLSEVELVPKDAHMHGNPQAPITIIEFGDLLCPACRQAYPTLVQTAEASNGTVRIVFRHFPLQGKDDHKMALPAANMAEIAADHGKFWKFVEEMYKHDITELQTIEKLYAVAKDAGLDIEELKRRVADENDPAFQRAVRDIGVADKLGLVQTPTFVLMVPGKEPQVASQSTLPKLLEDPAVVKIIQGGAVAR